MPAPIFDSSEFPMSTERLHAFENLNGNKFNVRVLGFSKDGVYPIRVDSKVNSHTRLVHVSLLKFGSLLQYLKSLISFILGAFIQESLFCRSFAK